MYEYGSPGRRKNSSSSSQLSHVPFRSAGGACTGAFSCPRPISHFVPPTPPQPGTRTRDDEDIQQTAGVSTEEEGERNETKTVGTENDPFIRSGNEESSSVTDVEAETEADQHGAHAHDEANMERDGRRFSEDASIADPDDGDSDGDCDTASYESEKLLPLHVTSAENEEILKTPVDGKSNDIARRDGEECIDIPIEADFESENADGDEIDIEADDSELLPPVNGSIDAVKSQDGNNASTDFDAKEDDKVTGEENIEELDNERDKQNTTIQSESLNSVFEDGIRELERVMQEVEQLEGAADTSHDLNNTMRSSTSSIAVSDTNEDGLSRELSQVKESPIPKVDGSMLLPLPSPSPLVLPPSYRDETVDVNDGHQVGIMSQKFSSSASSDAWSTGSSSVGNVGTRSRHTFPSDPNDAPSEGSSTVTSVLEEAEAAGIGAIRSPWTKYLDDSDNLNMSTVEHVNSPRIGIGAMRSPWGNHMNHLDDMDNSSCSNSQQAIEHAANVSGDGGSLASSSGYVSSLTQSISHISLSTCASQSPNRHQHMDFLASNANTMFLTPNVIHQSEQQGGTREGTNATPTNTSTSLYSQTRSVSHSFVDSSSTQLSITQLREIYGCHSRRDAMKLALHQSNSLSKASSDLVDLLFEYLEKCCGVQVQQYRGNNLFAEDEEESRERQEVSGDREYTSSKGLSLPASAIGWLSSYIYPDEADEQFHKQWERGGELAGGSPSVGVDDQDENSNSGTSRGDSRLPNVSPSPLIKDRLSLLKELLATHITHLRITGDQWPPSRTKKQQSTGRRIEKSPDTPRRRGRMLLNFDPTTTASFLSFYRHLQNRPRIDLNIFPNLAYIQVDGIPPEWLQNLHVTNDTLTKLIFQRGCMLNVPGFFGMANTSPNEGGLNNHLEVSILSPPTIPKGNVIHGFGDMKIAASDSKVSSPSPIKRVNEDDRMDKDEDDPVNIAGTYHSPFPHLEHLCLSHCCIGESSGMQVGDNTASMGHSAGMGPKAPTDGLINRKSVLSRLKGLITLDLSHNELVRAESALAGLGDLSRLSAINLSHNRLRSMHMNSMQMLGNVTTLLLANNCLTNVRGLERLYSLKKLDLKNNKVSNLCDISALAYLPELMELDIRGNPIMLKGKRRLRIQMFNLFKESRLDINDSNVTYRELMSLLPQLDGSIISKKELVLLKYLSYAHTPSINSQIVEVSRVDADCAENSLTQQEEQEQTPEEECGDYQHLEPVERQQKSVLQEVRRRITRKATSKTVFITDMIDTDRDEYRNYKKVSKIKLRKQKLRPQQLGATLTLEEVVQSIRPYVEVSNQDSDSLSENEISCNENISESEDICPDCGIGVDRDSVNETDERKDITYELSEQRSRRVENIGGIDSYGDSDVEVSSEGGTVDCLSLATPNPNPSVIEDEGCCDVSQCSSNSTAVVANITRRDDNDDCSGEHNSGDLTDDESFQQQPSQNSSEFDLESSDLGSFKPVLERIDFAANERSATFDGPESYSNLSVAAYFELYCRSYVFPSTSHDDSIDLYQDKVQESTLPRIQLYQTDRDLMLWTLQQGEERTGMSMSTQLHCNQSERLVAVSKEFILPCGIAATARIPPKDTVVKGFRGNELFDAGTRNPFTMSDYQALLICISNAALYIIPNFDDGSIVYEHRRFPSPIPCRATFQDALWPHAYCRQPLKFLRKISFDGFGFQRLTLHFKLPGLRDEVYVQPENGMMSMFDYSYVIFTCNQKKTIQLIQSLQQAAKEASPIVGGVSIGTVLVENDNNSIIDAVSKALSRPNFSDDILHYQILHQTWSNSNQDDEGNCARRCLILTNDEMFLFNETYAGDLSACATLDHMDMSISSSVRYGDISMRTIASASVEDVSDVSISNEDPKFVTLTIKSQSRLRRSIPWLLKCKDRENAERLVHDVRRLCSS